EQPPCAIEIALESVVGVAHDFWLCSRGLSNRLDHRDVAFESVSLRHPLVPTAQLELDTEIAAAERFFYLLHHRPRAAVTEPEVTEVKRPVVDFHAIARSIPDQPPGRAVAEFSGQIVERAVQILVLGEQHCERRSAARDSATFYPVDLHR